MLQPALLGGVAIGVLSALPVINLANCCCAWILFGGGLAAYLMQQGRPQPISAGDGALVGLMAGAIGAVVYAIVSIPLNAAMVPFQTEMIERALAGEDMPPEAREFMEMMRGGAAVGAMALVGFFFMLFVSTVFGMIGGVFGALIFKKAAPPPPPPPAPLGGGFNPPGGGFNPPTFTPPPPPGQ
jgi:hypothetical protein